MNDDFSNYGRAVPLKNKIAHIKRGSFENFLITSKRKPYLVGTDSGSESLHKSFADLLNKTKTLIKHKIVTTPQELFLPNASTAVSEIYLKEQFMEDDMLIGLMFYLNN